MSDFHWRGHGPEFELSWAGSSWVLKLDGPRPGLARSGDGIASILTLEGISAKGRSCPWRSEGPSLVKFDCLFERVEATYAFREWGDLTVRAGWSLVSSIDAVDLEIQILASSVDFLKGLEIQIMSRIGEPDAPRPSMPDLVIAVEPRDRESAGLSYDGRETAEALSKLMTLAVSIDSESGFEPRIIDAARLGDQTRYIEFVHPEDVARRIGIWRSASEERPGADTWTRYGIFGHDLEKGVVLRSRMRGFWRQGPIASHELDAMFRDFRTQPLPLGP